MFGFLTVLVIGLVAGVISGILGTGASVMLVPVLTLLYGPKVAVPVMAVAAVMANAARVMVWWRQVATRPVLAYVVTGVPAAALGAGTMLRLPSTIVDGAIGLFFIAMVPGRRLIARTIGTLSLWHVAVAGAIIGFLTGIVVSTGPISVPVFVGYGLTGGGFIGTEAGASLAIFVAKALTFRSFGALPSETVFMGLGVGGALMAGTFLSKPFVQTMAPETFRLLMDGLMLVSGLSLLWAAIVG